MELTLALDTLEKREAALQAELSAVQLARKALAKQFAPELKVIENARAEIAAAKAEAEEAKEVVEVLTAAKEELEQALEVESADGEKLRDDA